MIAKPRADGKRKQRKGQISLIQLFLLGAMVSLLAACDQGLAPKAEKKTVVSGLPFGIQVYGGDPTGSWMHSPEGSLEALLENPDQIKDLVDSLHLQSMFGGLLELRKDSTFTILGQIVITPTVWIGATTLSLPPFVESLNDSGRYWQPWTDALVLPLHTQTFKIDTIGFTATADSLTLVTLPSAFPFQGFDYIRYFLVFHLVRLDTSAFRFSRQITIGDLK